MILTGLHAQVLWGDYVQGMTSRYDEIEQFLHARIINEDRNKTREDWKRAIATAHKVCINSNHHKHSNLYSHEYLLFL